MITHLMKSVDELIIGGHLAVLFAHVVYNMTTGETLFDSESADCVPKIMTAALEHSVELHIPSDFIVSSLNGHKHHNICEVVTLQVNRALFTSVHIYNINH